MISFLSPCGAKLLVPITSLKSIQLVGKNILINSNGIHNSFLHQSTDTITTSQDNTINFLAPCGAELSLPMSSIKALELFGQKLIIAGKSIHSTVLYQTRDDALCAFNNYRNTLFNCT